MRAVRARGQEAPTGSLSVRHRSPAEHETPGQPRTAPDDATRDGAVTTPDHCPPHSASVALERQSPGPCTHSETGGAAHLTTSQRAGGLNLPRACRLVLLALAALALGNLSFSTFPGVWTGPFGKHDITSYWCNDDTAAPTQCPTFREFLARHSGGCVPSSRAGTWDPHDGHGSAGSAGASDSGEHTATPLASQSNRQPPPPPLSPRSDAGAVLRDCLRTEPASAALWGATVGQERTDNSADRLRVVEGMDDVLRALIASQASFAFAHSPGRCASPHLPMPLEQFLFEEDWWLQCPLSTHAMLGRGVAAQTSLQSLPDGGDSVMRLAAQRLARSWKCDAHLQWVAARDSDGGLNGVSTPLRVMVQDTNLGWHSDAYLRTGSDEDGYTEGIAQEPSMFLQVVGTKRWTQSAAYAQRFSDVFVADVHAGDVLFLPQNAWHETECLSHRCVSLQLSVAETMRCPA